MIHEDEAMTAEAAARADTKQQRHEDLYDLCVEARNQMRAFLGDTYRKRVKSMMPILKDVQATERLNFKDVTVGIALKHQELFPMDWVGLGLIFSAWVELCEEDMSTLIQSEDLA